MSAFVISPFGAARTAVATNCEPQFPLDVLQSLNSCSEDLGLQPQDPAFVVELTRLAEWPQSQPSLSNSSLSPDIFFLLLALQISASTGNTTLPFSDISNILALVPEQVFAQWNGLSRETVAQAIQERLAAGPLPEHFFGHTVSENKPILIFGNLICTHRNMHAEKSVLESLKIRAVSGAGSQPCVSMELGAGVELNPEQAAAVAAALTNRITFITGGPGTGKTSVVTALVKNFIQNGGNAKDVALTAPTGKAAKRLDETVRRNFARMNQESLIAEMESAATVHRLLGISESRKQPKHHATFPLPHRLVVADEASMLDVALFEKLVNAIKLDSFIVLLGDADQLPSVEAGALFRALTQSEQFANQTRRLNTSYRMSPESAGAGRNILLVANGVNQTSVLFDDETPKPNDADSAINVRSGATSLTGFGVEFLCAETHAKQFAQLLKQWLPSTQNAVVDYDTASPEHLAAINFLCEQLEKRKVLCVTNTGKHGADSINRIMHSQHASALHKNPEANAFLPGEPLIVIANDYSRNIFNGDIGVVVQITDESNSALHAAFRRPGEAPLIIPLDAIAQNIKHAFAITVHKSQGSEYESVLVCLPDHDGPLCSREIVYTALTRASRHVVIWGKREILRQATQRRIARTSLLDTNNEFFKTPK